MRKLFSLLCAVSLFFCCVFVVDSSAVGAFSNASQAVSKIIAASKTSKLGQRVLTTAMVVATCANLLSCGDWEQEAYRDFITNEAEGLPIMQGATTSTQTQVFVLTTQSDDYDFSLVDGEGNEIFPVVIDRGSRQGYERVVQHVSFKGLIPNSTYLLQVHSAAGELLDERELQTLDPSKQELRFAFGSCMSDYHPQGDIWLQMVALSPDVIFLVGDNVYTNNISPITAPDFMWMRYVSTRSTLNLFRSRQLIPVIAVWDDHDYGMSNGDLSYPHKEESLSIFKTFFASNDTENFYMPDIGAASFFSIYGYNFFLLDDRTFRTPQGSSPEWHFGEAQSRWLLNNLVSKDYAFLISGDQFFGGYIPKDSFQGSHPERFVDFLHELKSSDTKAVFLSGDRHFAEIMEIPVEVLGYSTYEFTSSPVHAILHRKRLPRNPLRVAGEDPMDNFMLIEASKLSTGLRLTATSYTVGGAVLFSGDYTID